MIEHFPDPYPDEVLYSVWARYSEQVAYPFRADVHWELFGRKYANTVVDFPCHLNYFVNNLPYGHIYTADFFIDYHTLLPFYSPFLPLERISRLRQQMSVGSAEAIHSRLGSIHNSIPRPQWLRYCPLCVKQDRDVFGETYWHRLHQVPGVLVCPIHATFLKESKVHARRDFSDGEFVSAEQIVSDMEPSRAASSPFYEVLSTIASDVLYLLEHPQLPRSFDFLREQYAALLGHRGFLTRSGHIRKIELWRAFMEYYSPTLLALLHCELDRCQRVGYTWLGRLVALSSSKGTLHPVQHMLAIRFLGSTIETFLGHRVAMPTPFGDGPWPCLNPVCEHYRQVCITSYELGRHSTATRPVGVFTCTCGLVYTRSGPDRSPDDAFRHERITSYGPLWEARLCELWSNPTLSVASIGRHLGVGNHTVNYRAAELCLPFPRETLRTATQVGSLRHSRAMENVLWYRSQWLALLSEVPNIERSDLRKRLPGVHKWLWSHDRQWLMEHLPLKKRPRKYETARQLWASSVQQHNASKEVLSSKGGWEADAEVAKAIREMSSRLIATIEPPKRMTLHRISKEIPQARQLSRQAHKAPLTAQAIKDITETPEDFTIRFIWWLIKKHEEGNIQLTQRIFRQRIMKNFYHTVHLPAVRQAFEEAMIRLTDYA